MININSKNFGRPAVAGFLLFWFLFRVDIFSQEGLYFTSSFQVSGGKYIYNSYSRVISIYGGLRYQGKDFGVTASIPLVTTDGNSNGSLGGMMGSTGTTSGSMQNGLSLGLGDLYGYFDYKIISDYETGLDLFANAQVKIPTANVSMNIGTGKIDFGGSITLRKSFDDFVGIVDIGYLNIGDPDSVTYKNPFTYGIGLGKFFNDGKYSVLFYYAGYTKMIDAYDAPRQISLGINYRASENIILSLINSAGVGNTSPDFTLSGGIRIKL